MRLRAPVVLLVAALLAGSTGELVIRAGTHDEFSFDLSAWYTTAWMDRYVKHDPRALRRLLTDRSRHDLGRDGGPRVRCEDLPGGCEHLVSRDGHPASYSYLAEATSPDQ